MKGKKSILIILSILFIVSLVVFSSCGKDDTNAIPTNADPAPTEEPSETPAPTPESDERMHFDDFVEQYNTNNSLDLNTSSSSIQEDFFIDILNQDYTRANAVEDRSTVSKENALLLGKYIDYIDSLHESCDFDTAVDEFTTANPTVDLSQDPTPLYEFLLEEGIDPSYIQQTSCDNEYVEGFIRWVTGDDFYIEGGSLINNPDTETHLKTYSEKEVEEMQSQYEAFLRGEALTEEQRAAREAADQRRSETNNHGAGNNF